MQKKKDRKNPEHNDKFIFDREKATFFSFLSGAKEEKYRCK